MRDSLGLREGSRLRLEVHGGKIEAVPEAAEVPVILKKGIPVLQGGRELAPGELVEIIKSDREGREQRVMKRSPGYSE